MARVAVIILNWNGLELTNRCLESLQHGTLIPERITVLDNGSKQNEAEDLRQRWGNFIQCERSETNLGFTGGNNLVMQRLLNEHKFDYIILLNQDAQVDPYCISKLVDYLDNTPSVAVAGPLVLNADKKTIQSCGAKISWLTGKVVSLYQNLPAGTQPSEPILVDSVIGCCWCVRTTALQRVGLFDDRYFAYYEEVDWAVRATAQQWQLAAVPQAVAFHDKSAGFRTFLNVRNMAWFMRRHAQVWQLFIFFCYFWTIFMIERLRKGSPKKELLTAAKAGWWL